MLSGYSTRLTDQLNLAAREVETAIEKLLSAQLWGETARSARLIEAMRYAALRGGKRTRPFLLIESARLFGTSGAGIVQAAAAIECLHINGIVFDDLPCMDDGAIRRGRPALHRQFDEATAILAGEAFGMMAISVLSDPGVDPDPSVRLALVSAAATAAGVEGMAGGQILDLEGEGRFGGSPYTFLPLADAEHAIRTASLMKTGALIRFACEAGAILGHASADDRQRIRKYGETLGLAFQLADDLLDAEGKEVAIGKPVGSDRKRGKATLPALRGVEGARRRLAELGAEAEAAITCYGSNAELLSAAVRFVVNRDR